MNTPLYQDDLITLYHGDCLEIMPTMPTSSVDMLVTDPPYLVNYRSRWNKKVKAIRGDTDGSWLEPAFSEMYRLLRPDGFCVSFYGWPNADRFVSTWKSIGFRPVSHLAFVKNSIGLGRFTRNQHETAYLLAKGSPKVPDKTISDVISWKRERFKTHPNQKPVQCLSFLLVTYSPRNGLILDPFCGSGSTLLAASQLGLRSIGIEIDESYALKAKHRLTNLFDSCTHSPKKGVAS